MHDRCNPLASVGNGRPALRRTWSATGRPALALVAALGFAAAPLIAHAQSAKKDVLYDSQEQATGGCPGMAWHVVVHPDKTLNGMVSWDNAKHMAHLTGTVDDHGAFKANAVETNGGKTGTATGTVQGKTMKASITGTGTGCDNQTMNVPMAANASSSG